MPLSSNASALSAGNPPAAGSQAGPPGRVGGTLLQQLGRGALVALAGLVLLTGCASTEQKQGPRLTGNLMVDGPLSIEQGPPRDKVLWEYRTAAGTMRQGKFDLAKQYLDDALLSLGGTIGKDKNARQARGYFHAEAKKTFIGEPYERSMAYIYRGILYWMDGEPDNARACFRSAELADSDTENHQYAGDWVLPDYLDGFASVKLGGDGSDAFKRAEAASRNVKLPPYNPKANVLFFIEFGPGPVKYASGEYSEQLRFHYSPSPVLGATVKVDAFTFPVAPTDDVGFQATTRGGRVMDHILGNKAVFKSATDIAGNVGIMGGAATLLAGGGHNSTVNQVGVGLLAAGILSKVVSAATTPEADTRAWDNLPRYLSFASLPLTPGSHTVTVEFQDAGGRVLPQFTKNLTVQVPADGKDKVIFISDQSITPQNI
ncbi:MAG TPA: hypothetical protein VNZ22_21990 [Bacillota bacterium]|nr:hypothetical protein [Bacillota bacterium]